MTEAFGKILSPVYFDETSLATLDYARHFAQQNDGTVDTNQPAGGLVALAAAIIGMLAGLGGGWLIGINVAEGTFEEEEVQRPAMARNEMSVAD